jgi:lyase family enzyme
MIMASTEFAEVYEPFVTGRGASSTMPQKCNPISSELMLAASKGVRQHARLMLDAIRGEPPSTLDEERPGEPRVCGCRHALNGADPLCRSRNRNFPHARCF